MDDLNGRGTVGHRKWDVTAYLAQTAVLASFENGGGMTLHVIERRIAAILPVVRVING